MGRRPPGILRGMAAAALCTLALHDAASAAVVGPQSERRICVSVFRYGGAANGWSDRGAGSGAFPGGTVNGIFEHLELANRKFAAINTVKPGDIVPDGVLPGDTFRTYVEWVWLDRVSGISGAIEDLPDPHGNRRGDIQGGPASDAVHTLPVPSEGGSTGSLDIDFILKETADSECYPVVFVNSPDSPFAGLTVVENVRGLNVGVVTLVNTRAFPRVEDALTSRGERSVSTLAHEFAHAVCLDPAAAVGGWGDAGAHPPHPPDADTVNTDTDAGISGLPPHTPEGRGRKVGAGFADAGTYLRDTVTWFTGTRRSGSEAFTLRQSTLAHDCLQLLRDRYSPSFLVGAEGVSMLPGAIHWAPAVPVSAVPPALDIGLPAIERIDALSYDWAQFPPGRFRFKFSVDAASRGLAGSDVAARSVADPRHAADEYAAPTGVAGRGNVLILVPNQFGVQVGDDVKGLDAISPARSHALVNGRRPADFNRDGVLDGDARIYFSAGATAVVRDPGAVYVARGNGTANPPIDVYADRAALGLVAGDDIGSVCVRDNGNGTFDGAPADDVMFTLTRRSTSVVNGTYGSADILRGVGLGRALVVVARAQQLGLRPGDGDEIDALKCFTPPAVCDINRDGRVDARDVQLIFDARSTRPTIPGDSRDIDLDGLITVNDARICTLLCARPNCAQ